MHRLTEVSLIVTLKPQTFCLSPKSSDTAPPVVTLKNKTNGPGVKSNTKTTEILRESESHNETQKYPVDNCEKLRSNISCRKELQMVLCHVITRRTSTQLVQCCVSVPLLNGFFDLCMHWANLLTTA